MYIYSDEIKHIKMKLLREDTWQSLFYSENTNVAIYAAQLRTELNSVYVPFIFMNLNYNIGDRRIYSCCIGGNIVQSLDFSKETSN